MDALPINDDTDIKPIMGDGRFDQQQQYGPRVEPLGKAERLEKIEQDVGKLMELGLNLDRLEAIIADKILENQK